MIDSREYARWRRSGVAFELRSADFASANRSLATSRRFQSPRGDNTLYWGYWGDITSSPYLAFGLDTTDDPEVGKQVNGKNTYGATTVSEVTVRRLLWQLEHRSRCPVAISAPFCKPSTSDGGASGAEGDTREACSDDECNPIENAANANGEVGESKNRVAETEEYGNNHTREACSDDECKPIESAANANGEVGESENRVAETEEYDNNHTREACSDDECKPIEHAANANGEVGESENRVAETEEYGNNHTSNTENSNCERRAENTQENVTTVIEESLDTFEEHLRTCPYMPLKPISDIFRAHFLPANSFTDLPTRYKSIFHGDTPRRIDIVYVGCSLSHLLDSPSLKPTSMKGGIASPTLNHTTDANGEIEVPATPSNTPATEKESIDSNSGLLSILADKCVLIVENVLYMVEIRPEQVNGYAASVQRMATELGFRVIGSPDPMKDHHFYFLHEREP